MWKLMVIASLLIVGGSGCGKSRSNEASAQTASGPAPSAALDAHRTSDALPDITGNANPVGMSPVAETPMALDAGIPGTDGGTSGPL